MRRVDDPADAARVGRGGDARGRGRVRRPDRVHRAGGRPAAAHRGADPGRHPGHTSCTCSSGTARSSGGTRRWSRSPRRRNISEELRAALCADAVTFAESINYSCAGTVEFLVETEGERAGQHVFIEMNPRIQVEHTVTEEITDVDLVQAQMRIASGESPGRSRAVARTIVRINGAALQCRITTEDPANGFRPDTGTITAYRSAGGAGVRLDGGTVDTGVEISAHFDSMLVKLTCRGRTFEAGRGPGPAGAGRVPDPRRQHQHPVPAGGAGGSGLHRRRRLDRVHRAATRAADHPRARRPRHPAAALAGRGDGQQAVRASRRPCSTRGRSGRPASTCRSRRRRAPGSGCSSSGRRGSPPTCGRGSASRSPTPPSATRTSRCWPPGCGPRTCCGSPRTWAG